MANAAAASSSRDEAAGAAAAAAPPPYHLQPRPSAPATGGLTLAQRLEAGLDVNAEELQTVSMAAAWRWVEQKWVEDPNYNLMVWRNGEEAAFRHELNDRRQALSYRDDEYKLPFSFFCLKNV